MLETNIDDMNPEIYEYVMEKAFEKGALDVFLTPVIMKKNRPGILLSVLCEEKKRRALEEMIFRETTTFGIRRYSVDRSILERQFIHVHTKYGVVPFKAGKLKGETLRYTPEYDICRKIAMQYKRPIQEIYRELKEQLEEYLKQTHLR